ncbi:MAG: 4-hydroxy-3-methylbut-2-enyl diphosphate reductase [Treponema sp.]|jgi:4-hydroxy-3-methylbut-2-enyl diphosphate reductase|nr:4-hydroxy-3-methylbut-2-enyl diphosphate reductase [Treponema sp.]
MIVIRAKVLGFCMGVRRAMDMADAALSREAPVYAVGPLIHNSQAMEGLKERGLRILDERRLPKDLGASFAIIRAHGITPRLEEELVRRHAVIVDATCPKVKTSQLKARSLCEEGRRVFLAGERRHAEIIGIQGYAPNCIVVGTPAEAAAAAEKLFSEEPEAMTALIGQTTGDPAEYKSIEENIRAFFPGLLVLNTICGATESRQDSLRKLCAQVDAVVVAGGRESANTRRLLAIAKASAPGSRGKPAWLVEKADEIPGEAGAYRTVGLCAGASTPDGLIDAIEQGLLNLG